MSVNAMPAQGTELAIGSGSPVAYSDIPEVKSFNGPGGGAAVIDVTDLQSTAKEKRMGLQDEGQLGFNINYIPANAQHAALRAAKASGNPTPFRLTFVDTTVWTFIGFVTGFTTQGAVDGVVDASVTIEISGSITES